MQTCLRAAAVACLSFFFISLPLHSRRRYGNMETSSARRANKTKKVKFKSKVKILITRLLKPKRLRSSYLLGEKKCSHIKRNFSAAARAFKISGKRPRLRKQLSSRRDESKWFCFRLQFGSQLMKFMAVSKADRISRSRRILFKPIRSPSEVICCARNLSELAMLFSRHDAVELIEL